MKISELIALLEESKEKHGDILIFVPVGSFGTEEADTVKITDNGHLLLE